MFRVCLLYLAVAEAVGFASPPLVDVPGLGSVQGAFASGNSDTGHPVSLLPTNVTLFLGVPFAQPPIGDLRWRVPQTTGAWPTEPLDATKYGNCCMQTWPPYLPENRSALSEDCLYLNIYSPTEALNGKKSLPVMFWIHGGAYDTGCSDMYPGTRLVWQADLGVVYVATNYRLNVFGFLGTADLKSRNKDGSVGNYGLQDQRASMQWVHDHIASFGGNPNDVTIFGESAGGSSVINHLAQSPSFPLYNKAIIESGTYQAAVTPAASEKIYDAIKLATGCKDIACLVTASAEKLNKADSLDQMWGPTVDGVALTDTPWNLIRKGVYNNKVPIMLGSNREEAAFFEILSPLDLLFPPNLSDLKLDTILAGMVGLQNVQKVRKIYDPANYPYPANMGNYSQAWFTLTRILTDTVPGLGACGARNFSQNFHKGGSPAVFTYLFGHPTQEKVNGIPGIGPGAVVVPHASEIAYVLSGTDMLDGSGEEAKLALKVSKYWSNFAKTGDPNGNNLPKWPKYGVEGDAVNRLQLPSEGDITKQTGLRKEACDFWDNHPEPILSQMLPNRPGSKVIPAAIMV